MRTPIVFPSVAGWIPRGAGCPKRHLRYLHAPARLHGQLKVWLKGLREAENTTGFMHETVFQGAGIGVQF